MHPLVLELKHDPSQSFHAHLPAALLTRILADHMVLTIDAAQVAVPEKNIAYPVPTHQPGLFAEMDGAGRNNWQGPRGATSPRIQMPGVAAQMRADRAGFEHVVKCLGT